MEHREFQRVVAVFAYDLNSESMTIERQQDFIYKVVHGSAEFNVVSQLELLVQGDNKRYSHVSTVHRVIIKVTHVSTVHK